MMMPSMRVLIILDASLMKYSVKPKVAMPINTRRENENGRDSVIVFYSTEAGTGGASRQS
jgi:hypothetical protein